MDALYAVITDLPGGVLLLSALVGGSLLYHLALRVFRNRLLTFHVDVHKDCSYALKYKPHIGLFVVVNSANGSHRSVSLIFTSQEN